MTLTRETSEFRVLPGLPIFSRADFQPVISYLCCDSWAAPNRHLTSGPKRSYFSFFRATVLVICINCVESGIDTVARKGAAPNCFNVTAKQDGVTRWTLRPEERAVLLRHPHAGHSAPIVQTLRFARKIREQRSQLVYLLPTRSRSDGRDT